MTLRAIDSFMLSGLVYVDDSFANECYFIHKHYTFTQNYYYSGFVFSKNGIWVLIYLVVLGVMRRKMNYKI